MGYRTLTILILALHFGYLGYLVAGGFLAWRWPRTIWAHAAAAGWAVTTVTFRLDCPLTSAEDWSRQRAGEPPLTSGFIDRYVEGVLYPQRYAAAVQVLVALLVLGSWLGLFHHRRQSRRQVGAGTGVGTGTQVGGGTRAAKAGNSRTTTLT